jgi:molybdopterin-guanine dinucleotide biosynthesis protein A/rhodanese-related sulfurtransferase
MGRDKALVPIDGVAMARRVADALASGGCRPVVAVGGDAIALGRLGIPVVPDRWPGEGPLGGILTALGAASGPVLVLACDLPWIDRVVVRRLVDAASGRDAGVGGDDIDVVVATSSRVEPLCAVWLPSAEPHLRAAFDAGERAVHRAMERLRVRSQPVDAHVLRNVNHPGDLPHGSRAGAAGPVEVTATLRSMTVQEVSVDELDAAIERGATVVDVREAHEYAAGHVPLARLVPMGIVPDHVDAFRPSGDEPVYVICQSGGRSHRVCEYLAEQGVEAINVAGGTGAWMMSGRPVDVGSDPGSEIGDRAP